MKANGNVAATSGEDIALPTAGWSARGLRIGRVYIDSVHVHDAQGAFNFREFMDATLEGTSRKRPGRTATRYLEHLPPSVPTRVLSEEAADYLANMKRRNLAFTTLASQRHHFRLLQLATGDIPVSRITSDHIQEFWDVIRWWPANAGSYKKFRSMTDQEILEAGKASNRAPPAQSSMNLAKLQIEAFFNKLLKRRVISSSPMAGFEDVKRDLAEPATRRAFTSEEIELIFNEATFLPWAKKAPHNWWAPMIGLYSGARSAEVAQLKVADIVQQHGIWCLNIRVSRDDDGEVSQSLKGASSVRVIPIAQALLDAGFLDFVEDARESGHPRLFPQLKRGRKKGTGENNGTSYGAALTRLFSAHLKRHSTIGKGLAFHCFRHSFITGLGINRVPTDLIASITGHAEEAKIKFPVLERHYMHLPTLERRTEQLVAINNYKPTVSLPVYQRGQFAHCFGKNAKKYP